MADNNAGEAGLTDEQVAQIQIPELKDELISSVEKTEVGSRMLE